MDKVIPSSDSCAGIASPECGCCLPTSKREEKITLLALVKSEEEVIMHCYATTVLVILWRPRNSGC